MISHALALLLVGAAFGLTQLLGQWAEADFTAIYVVAVLLSSLAGGIGPGVLAAGLATALIAQLPDATGRTDFGWDDVLRAAVFMLVALLVSSLVDRLRLAVAQLRRADRAKDEFLAMLSHELKNPLTSILGWAEVLARDESDPQLVATAAASIGDSARAQQHMIDELLDVSRIVFDKFTFSKGPVDLVRVARATADVIRPVAGEKRVSLEVELPSRSCVVEGDEYRIRQVVSNLLANAVKFTPSGGSASLRVDLVDSQARVIVADSGEGIDPAAIPHLFERFHQANGAAAKGGLGLGLAIARHVMHAHGGSIAAFSAGKGQGATFTASFPVGTS